MSLRPFFVCYNNFARIREEFMKIEALIEQLLTHEFIWDNSTDEIKDNLATQLDDTDDTTYFYVGIVKFVKDYYKTEIKNKWHLKGIFELGFPINFIIDKTKDIKTNLIKASLRNEPLYLYIFSRNPVDEILLGFNNSDVYAFKSIKDSIEEEDPLRIKSDLSSETYYENIINFYETGKLPEKTQRNLLEGEVDFEFSKIPASKFELKYLECLYRYKQGVIEEFGLPEKTEKLCKLSNLVQILEYQDEIIATMNDIIVNYYYLDGMTWSLRRLLSIPQENKKIEFVSLIHSFSVDPYYLCVFLESQFAEDYCLRNFDTCYENIDDVPLSDIQIFIPEKIDASYYKKKYEMERSEKMAIQKSIEENSNNSFYNKEARDIILKDLKELHSCFNNKLYKASIILAGSILEAFLIDWLSEIKKEDFFAKDYMIFDKYRNKERRADLKDYIDEIQELKKPSWFDAGKKATAIRKKRNLVHAKLYINDSDISKETCTEVINYLEYVINTRWKIN